MATRLKEGELPSVPPIPKAAGALTTSIEDDIFKLDTNSLGSLDSVYYYYFYHINFAWIKLRQYAYLHVVAVVC